MLNAYLTATQNLLQNPAAPAPLYTTTSLTTYINSARGQLAGESQCIRCMVSLPIAAGTTLYPYANINVSGVAGVQGVINVRTLWYTSGAGQLWVAPQTFEEFSLYALNSSVSTPGPPAIWAQYGQGASGSLYVSPVPDQSYGGMVDTACYPIALVDDTTTEAIPYLWTDAVPYFAAYLALLSAQTGARTAEADKMFQRYSLFVQRARAASTPAVLPWMFEQTSVMGGINPVPRQAGGGG